MPADKTPPDFVQLHASCVSIGNQAILILGESGSGKSDLALRLIDCGAKLVGDDQVMIHRHGNSLHASPARNIEGLIEARGVGVRRLAYLQDAALSCMIKLVPREAVERMPEAQFFDCLGIKLPLLSLYGFEHSAPAKVRLFLLTLHATG